MNSTHYWNWNEATTAPSPESRDETKPLLGEMSHLDWLAAQAMPALVVAHSTTGGSQLLAEASYEIAEAMIRESQRLQARGYSS